VALLTTDDAPDIELVGPLHGSHLPDGWRRVLTHISEQEVCQRLWSVVRVGGHLAAIAGLRPNDDGTAYLGPCLVLPAYRGRGLQKRLIRERLGLAAALRARPVTTVHMRNTPSLKNLLNCGFRVDGFDPEHEDLHLTWGDE
jgi:GNAT superfamily N-acetyltransferase